MDHGPAKRCDRCGDCCRTQRIPVNLLDIYMLSARLEMAPEDFVFQYLELITDVEGERAYVMKEKACPFLSGNLCRVEDVKPTVCRMTPCPKNEEYREFFRKYGVMTLQFLQNTPYEMLRHGLNVEYTQDYLERHKVFKESSFREYVKRIEDDMKNRVLSWMLLKNMIALSVHPKYQTVILDKLKRGGINYI